MFISRQVHIFVGCFLQHLEKKTTCSETPILGDTLGTWPVAQEHVVWPLRFMFWAFFGVKVAAIGKNVPSIVSIYRIYSPLGPTSRLLPSLTGPEAVSWDGTWPETKGQPRDIEDVNEVGKQMSGEWHILTSHMIIHDHIIHRSWILFRSI
jgi:hypothetical protein